MEKGKERSRRPVMAAGGIMAASGLLMMLVLAMRGGGRISLWGAGFNGLLILLGIAAAFCPPSRLTEENVPEVRVRENRIVLWLGALIFVLGMPFCIAAGVFLEGDPEGRAVCGTMGAICAAAGVWLLLAYRSRGVAAFGNGTVAAVTSFGRSRTFSYREIQNVSVSPSGSFCAKSADKKVLFRFENNMEDSELLLAWLNSRGVELCFPKTEKPRKDTGTGQSLDKPLEWDEADAKPAHKYLGAVRAVAVTAAVLAVAGSIVPLFLPELLGLKKSILVMAFSPFLMYLCFVLFPGVVVPEKPDSASKEWKRRHVGISWMLVCLLGVYHMKLFSMYEKIVLQVVDSGKMMCLILSCAAVLIVLLAVRTPKKLRKYGLLWLLLFSFCISWGIAYGINLSLSGKPEHFEARITDTDVREEDGDTEYYVTVQLEDQTELEMYVGEELYHKGKAGEPLTLCLRNSVFGIRMADLHLPEED